MQKEKSVMPDISNCWVYNQKHKLPPWQWYQWKETFHNKAISNDAIWSSRCMSLKVEFVFLSAWFYMNILWRYSRPAWTSSCAACCRWPCFGRRVGLEDPRRSLPTPTICDSVILWFYDFWEICTVKCTCTNSVGPSILGMICLFLVPAKVFLNPLESMWSSFAFPF